MKLSIITVSWNVKDKLRQCINSVFVNTAGLDVEYFVVDNASCDGTVEMLAREFPRVRVIANRGNYGFARANNQAISQSNGEFVLLLNPDMRVLEGTLTGMVEWMFAHKMAFVAGCKLVDENGGINYDALPRRFPELLDQLAIMLKLHHIFPRILDKYLLKGFDASKEQAVDSVRGSFFMIRREALVRLRGLDERYFIWFEEVDFCMQVWQSGGEVWYVPHFLCVDYIGQSFKQQTNMWRQKQFTKSMVQYFGKWHPLPRVCVIRALRPLSLLIAWAGAKIRKVYTAGL